MPYKNILKFIHNYANIQSILIGYFYHINFMLIVMIAELTRKPILYNLVDL